LSSLSFQAFSSLKVSVFRFDLVRTPFHRTALWEYLEVTRLLISSRANVNAEDENGKTLLHKAARKGYSTIAKVLLAHGASSNARNHEDLTPFHKFSREQTLVMR